MDELLPWLADKPPVQAMIHMGAISATTERDWQRLLPQNVRFSQQLWLWCTTQRAPFFYASSAATYGAGDHGYSGTFFEALRLLNAYG